MQDRITTETIVDNDLFIEQLVAAGFEEAEAQVVLGKSEVMSTSPADAQDFQQHFKTDSGDVDIAKVDAFMHIQGTKMTVDSYMPVIERAADNVDNNVDLDNLRNSIELFHLAGYSGQQIADTLNDLVKVAKSFTPHPTEGLSPNGIKLSRDLVQAAEQPTEDRLPALQDAAKAIATSDDFEASKKSNMRNETDYSGQCARIHNEAVNELDRRIEDMIFEFTGDHVDVNLNTGPRSWDYDADGKNNAEGLAMMMKMSSTTMDAMACLLYTSDAADE